MLDGLKLLFVLDVNKKRHFFWIIHLLRHFWIELGFALKLGYTHLNQTSKIHRFGGKIYWIYFGCVNTSSIMDKCSRKLPYFKWMTPNLVDNFKSWIA